VAISVKLEEPSWNSHAREGVDGNPPGIREHRRCGMIMVVPSDLNKIHPNNNPTLTGGAIK
jgi:hypothetical protein